MGTISQLKDLVRQLEREIEIKDKELDLLRANLEEIIQDHSDFRDFVDQRARHIRQLVMTHTRRLEALELRQAAKGLDTEPATLMEIQDIRAELDKLRSQLQADASRTGSLGKV